MIQVHLTVYGALTKYIAPKHIVALNNNVNPIN